MNEHDFTTLVDRHREEVLVGAPPPGLLREARAQRRQRRGRVAAIATAAAVVLVAGGLGVRALDRPTAPSHPSPTSGPTSGPTAPSVPGPGLRAVGVNGWSVQVPAGWATDDVGCDQRTPMHPTVIFDHHRRTWNLCGVMTDRPQPSVTVSDRAQSGRPWRTIDGVPVEQVLTKGACATCFTLSIPSAPASFEIHARSRDMLARIRDSLRRLPSRTVAIPTWYDGPHQPQDQMTRRLLAAGLRPHVVEAPGGMRPGDFVRTDPPVGTPVSSGRSVTVVYSSGDLAYYATPHSLARHAWRVRPATTWDPPVSRLQAARTAVARAGLPDRMVPAIDVFLRRLTVTDAEPRRTRLVWLAVPRVEYTDGGNRSTLMAIDAHTGEVVGQAGDFHGTS